MIRPLQLQQIATLNTSRASTSSSVRPPETKSRPDLHPPSLLRSASRHLRRVSSPWIEQWRRMLFWKHIHRDNRNTLHTYIGHGMRVFATYSRSPAFPHGFVSNFIVSQLHYSGSHSLKPIHITEERSISHFLETCFDSPVLTAKSLISLSTNATSSMQRPARICSASNDRDDDEENAEERSNSRRSADISGSTGRRPDPAFQRQNWLIKKEAKNTNSSGQ